MHAWATEEKTEEKWELKKWVLKCVIGHRWRTCRCSTFRFYDVWMLSKLLLGGKDHIRSVKFFFSLSCSSSLAVKSWLLLPPCCLAVIKQVNWKTALPQKTARLKIKDILQAKVDKRYMISHTFEQLQNKPLWSPYLCYASLVCCMQRCHLDITHHVFCIHSGVHVCVNLSKLNWFVGSFFSLSWKKLAHTQRR